MSERLNHLQQVNILTPEEIKDRLVKSDWMSNPERTETLILDILALLKSYDLNTYKGKGFVEVTRIILDLISPLGDFINVQVNENTFHNNVVRPVLFINSSDERGKNQNGIIKVPKLLIHGHLDVIGFLGKFGNRELYVDSENRIAFGRGTNDMLGQISVLILLLYILNSLNIRCFQYILTSAEELPQTSQAFIDQQKLLNIIGLLNIDAEPTSSIQSWISSVEDTKGIVLDNINEFNINDLDKIKFEIEQFLRRKLKTDNVKVAVDEFSIRVSYQTDISLQENKIIFELLKILRKYNFKLENSAYGIFPGFDSKITPTAKKILESAFSSTIPNPKAGSHDHLSTGFNKHEGSLQSLIHHFGTNLTISGRYNLNTVIGSIREHGRRHGCNESSYIDDYLDMLQLFTQTFIEFDKSIEELYTDVES